MTQNCGEGQLTKWMSGDFVVIFGDFPSRVNPVLSRIGPKTTALIKAAVITLAVAFVYGRVMGAGWIWDDALEITGSHDVRSPGGLWSAWFSPSGFDYFPLKTDLQWLEWHLWQSRPAGYHAANIVVHLAGALLLWRLLGKLGVRFAWLGGLLFAIHPLAVESVAWVSEFKNVLSLAFLLLAAGAFVDFDSACATARLAGPGRGNAARRAYLAALAWFLAAMLSKSSVVMFPFCLLLLAWWRRGRIGRRDLLASLPFFLVSLILGLVTISFQAQRAIVDPGSVVEGLPVRLAVAGRALVFYFGKCAWPFGLLPIYPRWAAPALLLPGALCWLAAGAVAAALLIWNFRSAPGDGPRIPIPRHILLGLGFFVINLIPVLGFFPMAYQRISWVADHFAYLALAGMAGLAAGGVGTLLDSSSQIEQEGREEREGKGLLRTLPGLPVLPVQFRWIYPVFVSVIIAGLAIQSRSYARVFQGEKSLWTYELERNKEAWIGYNNLGIALRKEGRRSEAIADYEQSLRLRPNFAEAHNDLGVALAEEGRAAEALAHYERAILIKPDFASAYNNEGNLLLSLGRIDDAVGRFSLSLRLDPDVPEPHNNLGNALARKGRLAEAIAQYREALRIAPEFPEAISNLGATLANSGRLDEAIAQFRELLRLRPDFAEGHNNLGVALGRAGRIPEAIAEYRLALQIDPGLREARDNLKRLGAGN